MVVTDAGKLLAERAAAILRLVEDTRAEVSVSDDTIRGSVSLGVPPTAGEVIAGRLIERFLADYPEVTLRIVPAFSGYLLDMLQRGELDLAVMYETSAMRKIKCEPLIEEDLFLIDGPASRLRMKHPVDFKTLANRKLILPGPRHGLRTLLEMRAEETGIKLQVRIEADALQVLKDLVARGLGCTVLPLAAIYSDLSAGKLKAAPILPPRLSRKLVLARSVVRMPSSAVRIFAEALFAETELMVAKGIWRGDILIERNNETL